MQARMEFNPKQLTSARVARGMTMKDLAEKSGLPRQMISNYETGKTKPKAESLLSLIAVLNFPRNFFSADISEVHSGAIYFRSQSAATKKVRDVRKERLKYLYEIVQTLSKYVNFPEVNLPELVEKDVHSITEEDIAIKAYELRKAWRVDAVSPIDDLVKLAEINGIIISEATMSDKHLDAVSRWIVDRPFIMLTD